MNSVVKKHIFHWFTQLCKTCGQMEEKFKVFFVILKYCMIIQCMIVFDGSPILIAATGLKVPCFIICFLASKQLFGSQMACFKFDRIISIFLDWNKILFVLFSLFWSRNRFFLKHLVPELESLQSLDLFGPLQFQLKPFDFIAVFSSG